MSFFFFEEKKIDTKGYKEEWGNFTIGFLIWMNATLSNPYRMWKDKNNNNKLIKLN